MQWCVLISPIRRQSKNCRIYLFRFLHTNILRVTLFDLGHYQGRTAYPYADPYFGGIVAAYGAQAMVRWTCANDLHMQFLVKEMGFVCYVKNVLHLWLLSLMKNCLRCTDHHHWKSSRSTLICLVFSNLVCHCLQRLQKKSLYTWMPSNIMESWGVDNLGPRLNLKISSWNLGRFVFKSRYFSPTPALSFWEVLHLLIQHLQAFEQHDYLN